MPMNDNPSRPGALAFPKALKIEMTLLQLQGSDVDFNLSSTTPGIVVPGEPPRISLVGIKQPVLLTVQLVATEEADAHFHDDPFDAMSFAKGVALPPGLGHTASGMFMPLTVSADGKELTFLAANTGNGDEYRARFEYKATVNGQLLAGNGGPIIIND
jgi:hypothetical protein